MFSSWMWDSRFLHPQPTTMMKDQQTKIQNVASAARCFRVFAKQVINECSSRAFVKTYHRSEGPTFTAMSTRIAGGEEERRTTRGGGRGILTCSCTPEPLATTSGRKKGKEFRRRRDDADCDPPVRSVEVSRKKSGDDKYLGRER